LLSALRGADGLCSLDSAGPVVLCFFFALLTLHVPLLFIAVAGIFIIYLTACANDFARENKRQTITANDVLAAVKVGRTRKKNEAGGGGGGGSSYGPAPFCQID
jgi:ABC-type protease/lipase transport system fused ATPase/permease subunit